jgi:hypothetical protein
VNSCCCLNPLLSFGAFASVCSLLLGFLLCIVKLEKFFEPMRIYKQVGHPIEDCGSWVGAFWVRGL